MATNAPSTDRVKRLRERRSRGVAMVAPVEVGEGGVDLLVSNGLLKQLKPLQRLRLSFVRRVRFCVLGPWLSAPVSPGIRSNEDQMICRAASRRNKMALSCGRETTGT